MKDIDKSYKQDFWTYLQEWQILATCPGSTQSISLEVLIYNFYQYLTINTLNLNNLMKDT